MEHGGAKSPMVPGAVLAAGQPRNDSAGRIKNDRFLASLNGVWKIRQRSAVLETGKRGEMVSSRQAYLDQRIRSPFPAVSAAFGEEFLADDNSLHCKFSSLRCTGENRDGQPDADGDFRGKGNEVQLVLGSCIGVAKIWHDEQLKFWLHGGSLYAPCRICLGRFKAGRRYTDHGGSASV